MSIFLLFLLELLLLIPVTSIFPNEIVPWLFIFVNFTTTCFVLRSRINFALSNVLILAFICRIVLIIINSNTGILESISSDSSNFHNIALAKTYGLYPEMRNNYALFLSMIYTLIGPYQIIGEYINILFGIGSLIGIANILKEFNLSHKYSRLVMCFICFSPFRILYDCSLLREAWVSFFIVWSILYFIRWLKYGLIKNVFIAITCVLIAAIMHGGSLFIVVGYLVAFSTYDQKNGNVKLTIKTVFVLSVIILSSILLFTATDVFTSKINRIMQAESIEDAVANYARDTGRSAYLTWINPQNTTQILLYSPLKMFYFLFSPLPMNWSSAIDLIGFFTDSIIYFFLLWFIYRNYKNSRKSKVWTGYLSISIFFVVFVFAYGTWNAGTAVRHRTKILPLILTMFAVVKSEKEKARTKVLQYKYQ